jgi:hypothetical protein
MGPCPPVGLGLLVGLLQRLRRHSHSITLRDGQVDKPPRLGVKISHASPAHMWSLQVHSSITYGADLLFASRLGKPTEMVDIKLPSGQVHL